MLGEWWHKYEVAYGMQVRVPFVLKTHGLLMNRFPLEIPQAPQSRLAWVVFITLWVRQVAIFLLTEAGAGSYGMVGTHDCRLWWVSKHLRYCMTALGPDDLVGRKYATRLAKLEPSGCSLQQVPATK